MVKSKMVDDWVLPSHMFPQALPLLGVTPTWVRDPSQFSRLCQPIASAPAAEGKKERSGENPGTTREPPWHPWHVDGGIRESPSLWVTMSYNSQTMNPNWSWLLDPSGERYAPEYRNRDWFWRKIKWEVSRSAGWSHPGLWYICKPFASKSGVSLTL